jgi:hypothetical protein
LDEGDLMIALGVELEDKLLEVEQQGLPPDVMRRCAGALMGCMPPSLPQSTMMHTCVPTQLDQGRKEGI